MKSSRRNEKSNVINICCVGTVNERKGQRHLIEAVDMLPPQERGKIHINIVGDGEIKEDLVKLSQEKKLSDYFTFMGNRKDIEEILSHNDIFILPSHNEGLPIAILEAMRQGLPIISTKVGGIPEMIIDGKTGLLIEPSSDSVLSVFKNISSYDWKNMGIESKRLFNEKFSLNSMVDKYSTIFHEIMEENRNNK